MTAYLAATYRISPFPPLWAARIAKVLEDCRLDAIVDLCSGSAGPMLIVRTELERLGLRPRVTLTDLYPASTQLRDYWPEPVDATRVPPQFGGVRTMFSAFHHFPPKTARAVLADAFQQRQPICIFEATSRSPVSIATCLLIPLLVFVLTPSIRPVSLFQIFFTYLIPLLPLLIFFDGLVSQLRTYSVEELRDLTRDLDSDGYVWECGLIGAPRVPVKVPYLIGYLNCRNVNRLD